MKTLFFANLIPLKLGAFEVMLARLNDQFQRSGDELALGLGGEPERGVAAFWSERGVAWSVLPGWSHGPEGERPWAFCGAALRLLRRERPDVAVVHFGNEMPALCAALAAPVAGLRGLKWVWQQDQQIADPSRLTARVSRLRLLALRFDHFVAAYEGGARSMARRGIPPLRITTVHNSISDHPRQRPAGWLHAELRLPREALLAVTTGSLIARKRIGFVIEAFDAARDASPGAILLVVGDGPLREELVRFVESRNLAGSVRFLGLRSDVRDILLESALYLHASLAETCTYAVSESMAAAIPAVVCEAGAAREQIEDGVSGFVLAPDDGAGFGARARELLADEARRRRMGQAARERWDRKFRVEHAAAKYHAVYRRAAGLE